MSFSLVYYLPCKPHAAYLNVTDSCLNNCRFCIRRDGPLFFGQNLSLRDGHPDSAEIVQALQANPGWHAINEVVFCGMGEPLLRYDCVMNVCKVLKASSRPHAKIRVDTSGLHWSNEKRLELLEYIDILSVSLNAETAEKYEELCQPKIKNAYFVLMNFLKAVKRNEEHCEKLGLAFPEVRLSVVDTSEEEFVPRKGREGYAKGMFPAPNQEACQKIAASFGWKFVVKRLFQDSRDNQWDCESVEAACIRGATPEICKNCLHRH